MNTFFIFLLFYTLMIAVFGGFQYVVFKTYTRWYNYSFESAGARHICRKIAIFILVVGNLFFYSRFPLNYTTLDQSLIVQNLVIIPGGIYFAFIFILFVGSVVFYVIRALVSVKRRVQGKAANELVGSGSEVNKQGSGKDILPASGITRKQFLRTAGAVAFTAPFVITTGLSAATHRNYVITKKTLLFPGLPTGLEGLKLVHISDIHSGMYMNRNQISEIYEIVNSLHPQLVAITGDLVDTHRSEIPAVRDTISMLKSDYGVFACPGNHDHYASISGLLSALKDKPAQMLQNDAVSFSINNEPVSIIGIDDAGEGGRNFADFDRAFSQAEPDSFKLLLSHRPHMFDKASEHQVQLTLAGHTHGGQIGFNFAGAELYPIDLFHTYSRGHYTKGDMHHLYVNVGVGLVGAPIRLVRPEITELTLTSNPDRVRSETLNA